MLCVFLGFFPSFPLYIFSLNSNLPLFGGISKGWACKVEGGLYPPEGRRGPPLAARFPDMRKGCDRRESVIFCMANGKWLP